MANTKFLAERARGREKIEELHRELAAGCTRWTREEIDASPYADERYQAELFRRASAGGGSSQFTVTGLYYSL